MVSHFVFHFSHSLETAVLPELSFQCSVAAKAANPPTAKEVARQTAPVVFSSSLFHENPAHGKGISFDI